MTVTYLLYKEPFRPQYHFTPSRHWMNDPNGMVYYEGEYHLFYQHHPESSVWGPMHWGHAVSTDMVNWEHLPIAFCPDEHGAIFSGSAVVDWNDSSGFFHGGHGLVAIFTHHDEDSSGRVRQRQSLAYSRDKGRSWEMYAHNPVLSDTEIVDFRDPKVIWHASSQKWIMSLAANDHIRFYSSPDLLEWAFESSFGHDDGNHDAVWECPDLFELAVEGQQGVSKWVLLVSVGDDPNVPEGSRTQYFIGQFDGQRFVCEDEPDTVRWLDDGRDNYAGVTFSDLPPTDGRRILMGWMSNWKYANLTPTEAWRGSMTLPRELKLLHGETGTELIQVPVKELEQLRADHTQWSEVPVMPGVNPVRQVEGRQLEIIAQFEPGDASEFGFRLRLSDREETVVGYRVQDAELFVDRTRSGETAFHPAFAAEHSTALSLQSGKLYMRMFIDWSSIEVFGNEGQVVMTDLIFANPNSTGVEVYSKGGTARLISLDVYQMKSVYDTGQQEVASTLAATR
ncbi:glycoside hydrolase family 32 protein [Marinicrinis sediminis]|uniref:Glycoside hydrolase family 32 protein n=1 Tax=Marinicrinis sediminis TaxID=1652465 RepID=A0ABW5RCZ6_9BACL